MYKAKCVLFTTAAAAAARGIKGKPINRRSATTGWLLCCAVCVAFLASFSFEQRRGGPERGVPTPQTPSTSAKNDNQQWQILKHVHVLRTHDTCVSRSCQVSNVQTCVPYVRTSNNRLSLRRVGGCGGAGQVPQSLHEKGRGRRSSSSSSSPKAVIERSS